MKKWYTIEIKSNYSPLKGIKLVRLLRRIKDKIKNV